MEQQISAESGSAEQMQKTNAVHLVMPRVVSEKRLFLGENAEKFYGFRNLKPLPATDNML